LNLRLNKEKKWLESVIKNQNDIIDQLEISSQRLDHLKTENEELNSKLHVRDLEEDTLKNKIKTKGEIIQNLNKGYTLKVHELKLKIVEFEKYKQKKVKRERNRQERK
jgi:hypothetical protein